MATRSEVGGDSVQVLRHGSLEFSEDFTIPRTERVVGSSGRGRSIIRLDRLHEHPASYSSAKRSEK